MSETADDSQPEISGSINRDRVNPFLAENEDLDQIQLGFSPFEDVSHKKESKISEGVKKFINDIFQQAGLVLNPESRSYSELENSVNSNNTTFEELPPELSEKITGTVFDKTEESPPKYFVSSITSEERFVNDIIPADCSNLDPFLNDEIGDKLKTEKQDLQQDNSEDEFMNSILPDQNEISSVDPLSGDEDFSSQSSGTSDVVLEESEGESETKIWPCTDGEKVLPNEASEEALTTEHIEVDVANMPVDMDLESLPIEEEEGRSSDVFIGPQMPLSQLAHGDSASWCELMTALRRTEEVVAENDMLLRDIHRFQHLPGKPEATQIDAYAVANLVTVGPSPALQEAELLRTTENESKDELKKLEQSVPTAKENCDKEFQTQVTELGSLQEDLTNLAEHSALRKKESRLMRAKNFVCGCFTRRRRRSH